MKILANENFPLQSARILQAGGFDVKVVGVEFAGITDQEVLAIAIQEERTIVTFDRHYGELIFRRGYRPPGGVIYLRWRQFGPEDPRAVPRRAFGEFQDRFFPRLDGNRPGFDPTTQVSAEMSMAFRN